MTRERPLAAGANPASARSGAATRVARNFSFRMGSQILSALINVAGMVLIGNALGTGAYGEYAF